MSNKALALLLEQAKQEERQAQLAIVAAKKELEGYYLQVEQIEKYRLDYSEKMSHQGKQGLSASSYGHLNRFIVQLDEALAKQRQVAENFQQNVQQCTVYWQSCKEKTHIFEWLIEKKKHKEKQLANKNEQKQQDELSALAFIYQRINR